MGVRLGPTLATALGAVALAGALLTGCSGASGPDADVDGTWSLVFATTPSGPLDLLGDGLISLSFDGKQAGGRGPCNDYGSDYEIDGTAFELGPDGITQTFAGCDGAAGVLEAAYTSALADVDTALRGADSLVLSGGDVELRFDRMPEWPREDVVGRTWRLHATTDTTGSTPLRLSGREGRRPSLTLHDAGRFVIGAGCLGTEGRWIDWRGLVTVTESQATSECTEAEQERAPVAGTSLSEFSLAVRMRSEREELVLTQAHGDQDGVRTVLVYRR